MNVYNSHLMFIFTSALHGAADTLKAKKGQSTTYLWLFRAIRCGSVKTHLIYEAQLLMVSMRVQCVPASASYLTWEKPEIELCVNFWLILSGCDHLLVLMVKFSVQTYSWAWNVNPADVPKAEQPARKRIANTGSVQWVTRTQHLVPTWKGQF